MACCVALPLMPSVFLLAPAKVGRVLIGHVADAYEGHSPAGCMATPPVQLWDMVQQYGPLASERPPCLRVEIVSSIVLQLREYCR